MVVRSQRKYPPVEGLVLRKWRRSACPLLRSALNIIQLFLVLRHYLQPVPETFFLALQVLFCSAGHRPEAVPPEFCCNCLDACLDLLAFEVQLGSIDQSR